MTCNKLTGKWIAFNHFSNNDIKTKTADADGMNVPVAGNSNIADTIFSIIPNLFWGFIKKGKSVSGSYVYALTFILLCFSGNMLVSQAVTGTIWGEVVDLNSEVPIAFVNIAIVGNEINTGAITGDNGEFVLQDIPVGRYQVQCSYIGYETVLLSDVLITSGNNPALRIKLKESQIDLGEVVIRARQEKEKPLNQMATISAKQLNMEEANRYAGGFDDPARLVTSFAGVTAGVGDENGLSVRGNSPKSILWQIEGVPVPNPNHFGEINGFGGGGISALSVKTLGNSDFFMGAFPAEYGNALSSVFDLTIRKGNSSKYNHSVQVGTLGLEMASEGPFSKKSDASYLFNYRYSTLGLFGLGINYQDISFKLNFPTKNYGTFSVWGLGLKDGVHNKPDLDTLAEEDKWKYFEDLTTEKINLSTGVGGLNHKILLGNKGYLKTTATVSYNGLNFNLNRLNAGYTADFPQKDIDYNTLDYRLASTLNYKFGQTHTNRTGLIITNQNFRFDLKYAPTFGNPLTTFANDEGSSNLIQAFSQSAFTFGKLKVNPGLHYLYFSLNGNYAVEPRLGLDYSVNDQNRILFGYGLHSQVEKLSYYLSDIPTANGNQELNRDLELSKSHHFVFGYDRMFGKHTHLRIEPFYQYHFDVPVVQNNYFSLLNLTNDIFINQPLVNTGSGKNMGIDFTFERFMHKGFYYLATLSIFDSKYVDGSGVERPGLYNRNVIGNFLIGKEWLVKKKNLFTANIKYNYLGGARTHPIDEAASLQSMEIVEDYTKAYSMQNPTAHVVSFTTTYRINSKKVSHLISLQVLNFSGAKEYYGHQYNFRDHSIDPNTDVIILPNLSYRFEF